MNKPRPQARSIKLSSCRSLIWVDSTQIRTEEQKKCQRLYQKLESNRKIIEVHESKSVPAFHKWVQSKFCDRLDQIKELNYKVSELSELIESIEAQSLFTGMPYWKVYEAHQKFREKAEGIQRDFADEASSEQKANKEDAEESFEKMEEEFKEEVLRSAFESFYGTKKQWRSRRKTYKEAFREFKAEIKQDHTEQERFRFEGNGSKKRAQNQISPENISLQENDEDSRLKEFYRVLARRLHPDLNPEMDPRKMEIWHQVQEAYEVKNLSRLETLTALSEIINQNWTKIDEISTLIKLFNELKNSLKKFEKKLRFAKKEKSWKFDETLKNPKELILFENQIKKELEEQYLELEDRQRQLESIIDSWSQPSIQKRNKRNQRNEKNIYRKGL